MVTHDDGYICMDFSVEFKNLDFFNFKFEVPTASVCKGALGKYDLSCGY